jgi:C6 transcription factor Pro1
MDGGGQERTVANTLRRQIADNRKRKRQEGFSANPSSLQVASRDNQDMSLVSDDEIVGAETRGDIESSVMDTHSCAQPIMPSGSSSIGPERLTSYREAELIMHYMDAVFPLQFRFHVPDTRGRGWLLWLLVQSRPLYHAALSLSALHQSIYMPTQFQSSYAELADYHAQALGDLRRFLQDIQEDITRDERSRKIEILSCGVSLISFEVKDVSPLLPYLLCLLTALQLFQGGISDWQLHLNALISILMDDNTSVMDLLREIEHGKGGSSESLAWQGTALSFLVTVILWFDLLSCVSTNSPPGMPYRELLDSNLVDMSTTMGVQNTVMRAIGDIATLASNDDPRYPSRGTEILNECHQIENNLRQALDAIHHDSPIPRSTTDSPVVPGHMEKVRHVTQVFASAALVQLSAAIPDYKSETLSVHSMVEDNISAIKNIRSPQDTRGLIWPICISGSMASTSDQQNFYEKTLKSALNGATRDFGNCATLLDILKWCWNSRRAGDVNHEKYWRHAMADIGTCLLV